MSRAPRTVRVMEATVTLDPAPVARSPSRAARDPGPRRRRPHRHRAPRPRTTRRSPRSSPSARPTTAPAIVERALRIGLLALQDAGVTVNVDVVRAEFEKLVRQAEPVNEKAAAGARADAPHELRRRRRPAAAHAREVPRRPRRAALAWSTSCSTRRSATAPSAGSARMLERYFDGDASKLAHPARPDPAQLPDAPVPPGDDGRVQGRSRSGSSRSRRPPRPAAPSGPGRRPRAATSRTSSRRCSATSPAAPATCSTGPGTEAGRRHEVQEGRLRPDPRRAGRARLRPAGRHRGQGPADVDAGDPRGAARGQARTAARPSALVVFTPAHAPAGVAPFNARRRRRLLRHRPGRARTRPRSRRPSGWPGCSPSPRSPSARSRWTPRPSPRP